MANLYINDTPGVTRIAPPVCAKYNSGGVAQSVGPAATIINFGTKAIDTDNAVTTGASWKFTCPVGKGGLYIVSVSINLQSALASDAYIFKNGAQDERISYGSPAVGTNLISLVAGDYIDIRCATGSPGALFADAKINWISITRVPDTNVSAGQSVATVVAEYAANGAQTLSAGQINFDVKAVDTDNAVTTGVSWKFTCPAGKGGTYLICGALVFTTAATCILYKNGSISRALTTTGANSFAGGYSAVIQLVPGDYIDIRASGTTIAGVGNNFITISKVPDQATAPVIQGYTPVIAKYGNSANQSLPNLTIIDFNTKEIDSDNAVTTGASWKFTCPIGKGGSYLLAVGTTWSVTSGNSDSLVVFKNGVQFRVSYGAGSTTAFNTGVSFSIIIDLVPGDYIDIRYSSPQTATLQGGVQYNWITIQSISTFMDTRADTGWIIATLTNNWQNYPGYTVKYRKIGGIVYTQGVLNVAGGQGVTTTSAFTLPVGFRPGQSTNKAAVASSYWLTSANYQPDGTVPCNFENVAAAYLDVSHCFPADG
jgi:hypothetical protein